MKDNSKKLTDESIRDFLTLKGSFSTSKKPLSSQEIHRRFSKYLANGKRSSVDRVKGISKGVYGKGEEYIEKERQTWKK
ncbi:hypothetical protein A2W14_06320 [Candidatus Gottesmanbacteria bacterium RBG_16_37_8]|uniref:Uncharacterized protein n=1 Tax=Candidatus Gottesmanbacteria bacterium RBG_16_37_8 TaxID=1798371 RepID=A0A1F5YPH6_9BACT|nr:MAG: hypothetical protein A2W14_06320 [Candidatus Gottesmanbacteria bacterium RBG_16_37_8]